MLSISSGQMRQFMAQRLARLHQEVIRAIQARSPMHASQAEAWLPEFARRAIESARAVRIDQPLHIERFACALFDLHWSGNELRIKQFTQAMASEASPEARLAFVEKNLVDHTTLSNQSVQKAM